MAAVHVASSVADGAAFSLNATLPGARSAYDSIAAYEAATGFNVEGRTSLAHAPVLLADQDNDAPVDLDVECIRNSGCQDIRQFLHLDQVVDKDHQEDHEALAESLASSSNVSLSELLSWARQVHERLDSTVDRRPSPGLGTNAVRPNSPSSTPCTDMSELTSDSGRSFDDDTSSSLPSPPPASPPMSPERAKSNNSPPFPHRLLPLLPRIRSLSTTSLPTTSFPLPTESPDPMIEGSRSELSFPSSLSLDLDLSSSEEDASSHSELCSPTPLQSGASQDMFGPSHSMPVAGDSHAPERKFRKTRTRDLVDQMRAERAKEVDLEQASNEDLSKCYPTPPPSDRPSPPQEDSDTPSTPSPKSSKAGPSSETLQATQSSPSSCPAPPARAASSLPRCSRDLKGDSEDWWLPMDEHAPAPFSLSRLDAARLFLPQTPRLNPAMVASTNPFVHNGTFQFPETLSPSAQRPSPPPPTLDEFPALPTTASTSVASKRRQKKGKTVPGIPATIPEDDSAQMRTKPKKVRSASMASTSSSQSFCNKSQAAMQSPPSLAPRALMPNSSAGLTHAFQGNGGYPVGFAPPQSVALPLGYNPSMSLGMPYYPAAAQSFAFAPAHPGFGGPQGYSQAPPPPSVGILPQMAAPAGYAGYMQAQMQNVRSGFVPAQIPVSVAYAQAGMYQPASAASFAFVR